MASHTRFDARCFHPVIYVEATSEATPRIVEVTGATVTFERYFTDFK